MGLYFHILGNHSLSVDIENFLLATVIANSHFVSHNFQDLVLATPVSIATANQKVLTATPTHG